MESGYVASWRSVIPQVLGLSCQRFAEEAQNQARMAESCRKAEIVAVQTAELLSVKVQELQTALDQAEPANA